VRIDGTSWNMIGGTAAGAGNTIAFNSGAGVFVTGGTRNAIRGNSIFFNTGLGIDLAPLGVTPNDRGDADTGANNLQNFPALTAAFTNGANSATILGKLNSTASTMFTLDFYASAVPDPTLFGEGARFLGSTTVMTPVNAFGSVAFIVPLAVAVPGNYVIAATATDPAGNTSEFSKVVKAQFRATSAPATTAVAEQPVAPSTDPLAVAMTNNPVPLSSTRSAAQPLGLGVQGAGPARAPSTGSAATAVLAEALAGFVPDRRTSDLAWLLDRDWAAGLLGIGDVLSLSLGSNAKS
jgi:hypothetical protein